MRTSFSVSDRAADGSFWPQQTFTACSEPHFIVHLAYANP